MRINDPDRSSLTINGRDPAQAPSGFAKSISDDFPVFHLDRIVPVLVFTHQLQNDMNDRRRFGMKRNTTLFFLLLFVFRAPAYSQCADTDCPKKQNGQRKIQHFGDCPDEGCTRTKHHKFDPELNKLKNIRSDNQQPVLRSIRWMKGLPDPTNLTECENRDELKQLGEGQK